MANNTQKRILFLTQVLPYPLDAGPKIRAYYVIRYLSQFYKITLLSFIRDSDPPYAIDHLSDLCERVITVRMYRSRLKDAMAFLKSVFLKTPFLIARDKSKEFQKQIDSVFQNSDDIFSYVHADQLWMAEYALYSRSVAMRTYPNPTLLLDQHNAVFLIPKRLAVNNSNYFVRKFLNRESNQLLQFEKNICQQFNRVVWVTEEDFLALYQLNEKPKPNTKNTVIPICISPKEVQPISTLPDNNNILFVGGMHWPPNNEGLLWFVEDVFPLIQEKIPDATLFAIGKSPPVFRKKQSNIISPGFVENLTPYWYNAKVFIVPIHSGGGMRVKILDAWAYGLPVVSTTIGAEGIKYKNNENILIADDPFDFAYAIIKILQNRSIAKKISANGRRWVKNHYDWKDVYTQWDNVYN